MREWLSYFFFKRRLKCKLRALYELEDPWSSRELSGVFAPVIREQMRAIAPEIRPAPVLDAGGGEGHYYLPLRDILAEYHLLDIEARPLQRAKELLRGTPCRFIHKSLDDFCPPADTYSAIWLFNVLTYAGGKQHPSIFNKILENLWRALKRDGIVLLIHPYYSEDEYKTMTEYGHAFVSLGGSLILNYSNKLGKQEFLMQAVKKL